MLLAKYKPIASQYHSAIYEHHIDGKNKVIKSDNINKFYRFANCKFTNKSSNGRLKSNHRSILIDRRRKVELLQTSFT